MLLAGVMVAGYVGLLPLLQSLAAEPAWPDAPGASLQAAPIVTVGSLDVTVVAASKADKATPRRAQVAIERPSPSTRRTPNATRAANVRPVEGASGNLPGSGLSGNGDEPGVTVGG